MQNNKQGNHMKAVKKKLQLDLSMDASEKASMRKRQGELSQLMSALANASIDEANAQARKGALLAQIQNNQRATGELIAAAGERIGASPKTHEFNADTMKFKPLDGAK